MNIKFVFVTFLYSAALFAQVNFGYDIQLNPINVPNLPGLHSYAVAQHAGKRLLVAGRKDGYMPDNPSMLFRQVKITPRFMW